MKTKLILAILLFSTFSTFGQKEMPSQFLGIGLNNIISLELNKTLNSNSLSSAPLNLVEFTYGIKYTPKRFGGFLDANYSIYGTDNSRTAMQSFKLGPLYKFPIGEKMNLTFGAHYSYSGVNIQVRNTNGAVINAQDLQNANGSMLSFVTKYHSVGGSIWYDFSSLFSFRVAYDVSLGNSNWDIVNNEASNFSPETISRVSLGMIYSINGRNRGNN